MAFLKEFRDFAIKGNVIDLAVGVIIGAAFGKIVDSLVNDMIMPLVARLVGQLNFSSMFLALGPVPEGTPMTVEAVKKAGVPVLAWGNFVTVSVNFLILAFVIFLMVQQVNRLRRMHQKPEAPKAAEPAPPPEDVLLLREIRDSLRQQPK
jgi:large conductance mechanosensitive channel